MPPMPSISEWLPSAAAIGFGTFLFGVVRADLKGMETRQREELREMRAEHRANNKALNEKLDRLVEELRAAKAL